MSATNFETPPPGGLILQPGTQVRGVTKLQLVKEALADEVEYRMAQLLNPIVFKEGKYKIQPLAESSAQVPFCPDCKANHRPGTPCEGRT